MRFFRKRRVEKRFYISITSSKTSGEPAPEVFYVEFANDLLKRIGINDIKFSADFSYYSSKTPAFIRDVEEIVNSRANPARDSRHNPASRNAESRSLNG